MNRRLFLRSTAAVAAVPAVVVASLVKAAGSPPAKVRFRFGDRIYPDVMNKLNLLAERIEDVMVATNTEDKHVAKLERVN